VPADGHAYGRGSSRPSRDADIPLRPVHVDATGGWRPTRTYTRVALGGGGVGPGGGVGGL
jgi:hypothetical protein